MLAIGRLTRPAARPYGWPPPKALVAELVDALVSGTSGESRGGSSPLQGTKKAKKKPRRAKTRAGL
jgi:hypothetical protein